MANHPYLMTVPDEGEHVSQYPNQMDSRLGNLGHCTKGVLDQDGWYPDNQNSSSRRIGEQNAAALCHTCPLRLECFRGAVQRKERFGIWGGHQYQGGQWKPILVHHKVLYPAVLAFLESLRQSELAA